MSAIGQQDSVIVDKVRELKRKSAQKRLLLVVLKSKAEVAVQEIEAKQRALEETAPRSRPVRPTSRPPRKQKYGKLGNVRAHRHELEGDLRALQAASAQVTNQLQGSGPAPAGPDPAGQRRLHLAGERPGRVAVRAALGPAARRGRHRGAGRARRSARPASGTVAMAGWMGGYGQYTASSTAAAWRPATRTSPRSASAAARA